jgi:hypothetical protein
MGCVANPQLRSEWQARLERWQRSGLGLREFCDSEDVGEPMFYHWRKKLGWNARERREKSVASPIKSLQPCHWALQNGPLIGDSEEF